MPKKNDVEKRVAASTVKSKKISQASSVKKKTDAAKAAEAKKKAAAKERYSKTLQDRKDAYSKGTKYMLEQIKLGDSGNAFHQWDPKKVANVINSKDQTRQGARGARARGEAAVLKARFQMGSGPNRRGYKLQGK